MIGEAAWGVDYLLETYPPRWFHINKKLIYEISKPEEPDKNNEIKVKRFLEQASPEFVSLPEIQLSFGNYKYLPNLEKDKTIHWHVNFADPCLFGFAAGAAGVRRLVFWVPHDGYLSHYHAGLSLAQSLADRKTTEVIKAVEERGFLFGAGNGT